MPLAHRMQSIQLSPTLTLAARARQLQKEGRDLINLTVGEPNFDTPAHIKEAAIRAIRDGFTKYTPVDGIFELKQAIINKFARDNHLDYTPQQVMVSTGCKQVLFNALQALVNPGDEVLIPSPYWVSYPDMAVLAEGKPVFIESKVETQFKINADQLEAAITKKSKVLILNSPSNPTGMLYSEKELQEIANVLLKHPQIFILSDDIYEHILWSKHPFKNLINVCPVLKDRTVICHGVSKTYAMTGWRIGFAAGPAAIISAMTSLQSQSTSNPNAIAQVAACAALEGDQSCVYDMTKAYQHRHQLVYDALSTFVGVKVIPADGTFYAFFDANDAIKTLGTFSNDIAFSEHLLEAGVVAVPGSAFGAPGCYRLSYACSDKEIIEAMERLRGVFGQRTR